MYAKKQQQFNGKYKESCFNGHAMNSQMQIFKLSKHGVHTSLPSQYLKYEGIQRREEESGGEKRDGRKVYLK